MSNMYKSIFLTTFLLVASNYAHALEPLNFGNDKEKEIKELEKQYSDLESQVARLSNQQVDIRRKTPYSSYNLDNNISAYDGSYTVTRVTGRFYKNEPEYIILEEQKMKLVASQRDIISTIEQLNNKY